MSLVGTSPLVSPKSVGVWYLGVPSSSNAPIGKMNGEAPDAESGKPARAVAVVETGQVGIPSARQERVAVRARRSSTVTATPFAVSIADADRRAADAVREAVAAATVRARVVGLRRVAVDEVVVGGGERGEVRRGLLVATLGEGGAAVEGEPGDPDEDDQRQGEHDEDLASAARAVRDASSDLLVVTGSWRCWPC